MGWSGQPLREQLQSDKHNCTRKHKHKRYWAGPANTIRQANTQSNKHNLKKYTIKQTQASGLVRPASSRAAKTRHRQTNTSRQANTETHNVDRDKTSVKTQTQIEKQTYTNTMV